MERRGDIGKRTAEVGVLKKNRQLMIGKCCHVTKFWWIIWIFYPKRLIPSALSAGAFRLYNLFCVSIFQLVLFFVRVFLLFFFVSILLLNSSYEFIHAFSMASSSPYVFFPRFKLFTFHSMSHSQLIFFLLVQSVSKPSYLQVPAMSTKKGTFLHFEYFFINCERFIKNNLKFKSL